MKRVECSQIQIGVRFTAPVFFDDGQCMFMAPGLPAKAFHIAALKRWNIPFLLTDGRIMEQSEVLKKVDVVQVKPAELDMVDVTDEFADLEEL